MSIPLRKTALSTQFAEIYGSQPQFFARAPGRVDLMGSHTDYNLGYVMTMTIDRDTWIALRARPDRIVRLASTNLPGRSEFNLDDLSLDPLYPWTNYIRGVAWALQDAGHPLYGFDGLIDSTIPFGSGLSSSAALEMAAAVAFSQVSNFAIDPVQMALLGQKAENQFVGVNCGILDQYSSALGQAGSAVLLDCRSLTHRLAPIAPNLQVVICDTRAKRNLAGTEYGERRAACEDGARRLQAFYPQVRSLRDVDLAMFAAHADSLPEMVARRCRFIIQENQRVLDLADALSADDRPALGRLLGESYAGARDLYEIGAPAMAQMMAAMLSGPGVIGARQAGAGFGGCMVALVEDGQVQAFADHVRRTYAAASGIDPHVYPVRPAPGAGFLAD
jgi:galactokinase